MDKDLSIKGLEKHYDRKRIVRITALVAGCVAAIIFSLALALDFEPSICFFKHGSILGPLAVYTTFLLGAAALILPFVIIPKEKLENGVFPEENRYLNYYTADTPFIKIVRICVAAVIFAQAVVRLIRMLIGADYLPLMPKENAPDYTFFATFGVLFYAVMMMGVFALGMYFIPEIVDRCKKTNGRLHLIFGSVGVFFAALNIINNYYDKTYGISSQYRLIEQLCFVSVILATVYDVRYRLDGTKIRARLAAFSCAFVFCFGFNVARTVMMITVGSVNGTDVCNTFTLLALSAYYGARLFFYEED